MSSSTKDKKVLKLKDFTYYHLFNYQFEKFHIDNVNKDCFSPPDAWTEIFRAASYKFIFVKASTVLLSLSLMCFHVSCWESESTEHVRPYT